MTETVSPSGGMRRDAMVTVEAGTSMIAAGMPETRTGRKASTFQFLPLAIRDLYDTDALLSGSSLLRLGAPLPSLSLLRLDPR
jgi:hypothetical protein